MAESKTPPLPSIPADERIITMPARYRGVSSSVAVEKSRTAADTGPATPHPRRTFLLIGGGVFLLLCLAGGAAFFFFGGSTQPQTPAVVANTNRNAPVAVRPPAVQPPRTNTNTNAPTTTTPRNPAPLFPETTTTSSATSVGTPTAGLPTPLVVVRNGADADADGLSDVEERELFGSDPAKPDSDGDGYLDGAEVFYLFSPVAQKKSLLESSLVTPLTEQVLGFSGLAPVGWNRQVVDAATQSVAWISKSGEFFQALVEENPDRLAPADWYLAQSPGVVRSQLGVVTTASGLIGVKSPDGLTVFLPITETRVLILTYNLGTRTEASFRRTFEMFAQSAAVLVPVGAN